MIVTHEITMDLLDRKSVPGIDATQDDRYTRNIAVTLLSGEQAWIYPDDGETVIRYSKPDGTGGVYDTLPDGTPAWTAEGNVLTLALAPQVLTVPGAVLLSAQVSRGEEVLSIFSIAIRVQPRVEAFATESGDYYNVAAFLPGPVSALEGQFLRIAEVDSSGRVVALEGAGISAGDSADSQEPATGDIPRLFFSQPLPQTKEDTVMALRYVSDTMDLSCWCKTKAQGNTSMTFPKKNQTVKLYRDAQCSEKRKVALRNWGKQSKFCFKANWIDLTHARNVVSARLWGDVVRSRENYSLLPQLYRLSPNQGAVDGFPVKVYAAGIYQGRYTVNIPKDAWMAGMDDSLETHCILCSENYGSGCFREAALINGSDWTDEIHDTVPDGILTRWNEVIDFVRNSSDEEFIRDVQQYFYLDSLIDYHLFGLMSCGLDAYGKNQLFMTYDGQRWIAGMYDMDATWGLWWNGGAIKPWDYDRSEYQDFQDGSGNLLYIRLEQCFYEQLQSRWQQLRSGALSVEHIIMRFEAFTDIAPEALVKEDYATTTAEGAFTGIPSKTACTLQQIRNFAAARHGWCDAYVAGLTPEESVACTGISLNMMSLMLNAGDQEVLTASVTPENCTEAVYWESSDEDVATVRNGTVTALANGTAVIRALCGGFSASAEVTVKGGTEVVDCAGITLSQENLSFTGEGSATLTATLTPSGCTESVTWESSDPAVASVSGGVVTAVGNGNAVITAVCGSFSAQCAVTVTGMAENLLSGVGWYVGEISETTGELVETVTAANYTDFLDIGAFASTVMHATCDGGNLNYSRIVFYDESYSFLSCGKFGTYKVVPENARYMRVSVYGASGKTVTLTGSGENFWKTLEIIEGGYSGGSYNASDTNSCNIQVSVISGGTLVSYGAWGAAKLDADRAVLSYGTLSSQACTAVSIEEGAAYVAVCATDDSAASTAACNWMNSIGSSVIQ